MKPRSGILVLTCCAVLAAGCLRAVEPTSRSAGDARLDGRGAAALVGPDARGFYPLELGNRWLYSDNNLVQIIPSGGPPEAPFEEQGSIAMEMACTETVGERQYEVEHATYSAPGGGTETWVRYRQDRTGLYELDVSTSDRPACAGGATAMLRPASATTTLVDRALAARPEYRPARSTLEQLERRRAALDEILSGRSRLTTQQVLEGELTRLAYPLRQGAQWAIRTDPAFTATVEGTDALDLPAGRFHGYRIRIEAPGLFGSNDRVLTWYDRHGALQLVAHFEGVMTDADGNVTGMVIIDETRKLEELSLVGSGRF